MNHGKPASKLRALARVDMSGGSLPPSAARAAWSLANGGGNKSEILPGRLNILPASFGPSCT
jgi:hypothetical protein